MTGKKGIFCSRNMLYKDINSVLKAQVFIAVSNISRIYNKLTPQQSFADLVGRRVVPSTRVQSTRVT